MNIRKRLYFWRIVLALIPTFALAAMIQMAQAAKGLNIQILHSNWILIFGVIIVLALTALGLLALLFTRWQTPLLNWAEGRAARSHLWTIAAVAGLLILAVVLCVAILNPYLGTYYFAGFFPRLLLFWCLSLAGLFCLRTLRAGLSWITALTISGLMLAIIYRSAVIFSQVTDYPFARGWSEISRFYGASLFFSQSLYGVKIPLPLLHPAWHLLLAPLYLFGTLPVWIFRFWSALLLALLTAALALAVAKRFHLVERPRFWLASGWVFLFLLQGPILIPLLVCAIIVVIGVRPGRFWQTTLVVLAASLWAGWCRINWFPVPGLMAAAIYLLEIPLSHPRQWYAYLWRPLFWFVVGTAAAFASNLFFVRWLANGNGGNFSSSLNSQLLWYRLLPNPTNTHGVLPDLILVSLPILLAMYFTLRHQDKVFHPLRLAGIIGILAVLCVGGLIVSTKIGGGSDLHNLDAFLILFMLVGGYFFFGRAEPENGKVRPSLGDGSGMRAFLLLLAVAIPVGMALENGNALFTWNRAQAERILSITKGKIESVAANGGRVLFISQRHLLALKMVNVPLIPEYEQDALMEMVMSNNSAYLDRFQADLRAQRFALIVAETQNVHFYGRTSYFGEENDLWVRAVSIPMLCYYEPLMQPGNWGITLYTPRDQPCK